MLGWSPICPGEGAEDLFSKTTAVLGCQAPSSSGESCNTSGLMVCVQLTPLITSLSKSDPAGHLWLLTVVLSLGYAQVPQHPSSLEQLGRL